MALFKFTKSILNNDEIEIYNNGDMIKDFTYIDDLTEGIISIITLIPNDKDTSFELENDSHQNQLHIESLI